MALVITAPETYIPAQEWHHKIFLAGAIDMGEAVDWQAQVIQLFALHENFVLFNPRRPRFKPDTLDEQIRWELDALETVDTVFMWFPKTAQAPIALFESGLYWKSGKLLIGAEPGFYRRRNLELTGERYNVTIHDSIQNMVNRLIETHPA